jgi:tetraacyldisaccharide 4'-kinase
MKLPRAPEFWWHRHRPAGLALAPLGVLYGQVSSRLMSRTGVTLDVPVICVGNLVIGGAGKTPTALEVANVCRKLKFNPGFLTRGYGGAERGPLCVTIGVHSAEEVGDEALLLAQFAPTVISADRPAGAKLLAQLGADVVVMDDGFQNPSLHKDLSLIVIDSERGIGNGFVFPAGPLRAPLAAQIRMADVLVVIGEGTGGKAVRIAARAGRPTLRAATVAVRKRGLKRRPYLAFSGIADPSKFYKTLVAAGATIGHTMDFPDHHLFTPAECEAILAEAKSRDLVPITTEKDRVRLKGLSDSAAHLAAAAEIFPIRIRFEEPRRLTTLITDAITAHGGAYRRRPVTSRDAEKVPV